MITLFCDLDNTILFSHRKTLNTSKRVAEMINGVEQSYITERTFNFLSSCHSVSVVPVTTRTQLQYKRVAKTLESFNCNYALILNGAVLLRDGRIDATWLNESKKLVKSAASEMEKASSLLERYGMVSLSYSDTFLSYARVEEPTIITEMIKHDINTALINVFSDSRKVYCIPSVLTKGNAVRRLLKQIEPGVSIAVGDSDNDLSMFETVDIPIVPFILKERVSNTNKLIAPIDQVLSDATCDFINNFICN